MAICTYVLYVYIKTETILSQSCCFHC